MPRTSSNFESLLTDRVDAFVADISELARHHAIETLARALDDGSRPRATRQPRSSEKRAKRTAGEVEKQADFLLGFIAQNPGKRAEEIAAEVGLPTKTLVLPMRRLTSARKVKTEGQKRATRYFATNGTSRGGKAAGRRRRGAKASAAAEA